MCFYILVNFFDTQIKNFNAKNTLLNNYSPTLPSLIEQLNRIYAYELKVNQDVDILITDAASSLFSNSLSISLLVGYSSGGT